MKPGKHFVIFLQYVMTVLIYMNLTAMKIWGILKKYFHSFLRVLMYERTRRTWTSFTKKITLSKWAREFCGRKETFVTKSVPEIAGN